MVSTQATIDLVVRGSSAVNRLIQDVNQLQGAVDKINSRTLDVASSTIGRRVGELTKRISNIGTRNDPRAEVAGRIAQLTRDQTKATADLERAQNRLARASNAAARAEDQLIERSQRRTKSNSQAQKSIEESLNKNRAAASAASAEIAQLNTRLRSVAREFAAIQRTSAQAAIPEIGKLINLNEVAATQRAIRALAEEFNRLGDSAKLGQEESRLSRTDIPKTTREFAQLSSQIEEAREKNAALRKELAQIGRNERLAQAPSAARLILGQGQTTAEMIQALREQPSEADVTRENQGVRKRNQARQQRRAEIRAELGEQSALISRLEEQARAAGESVVSMQTRLRDLVEFRYQNEPTTGLNISLNQIQAQAESLALVANNSAIASNEFRKFTVAAEVASIKLARAQQSTFTALAAGFSTTGGITIPQGFKQQETIAGARSLVGQVVTEMPTIASGASEAALANYIAMLGSLKRLVPLLSIEYRALEEAIARANEEMRSAQLDIANAPSTRLGSLQAVTQRQKFQERQQKIEEKRQKDINDVFQKQADISDKINASRLSNDQKANFREKTERALNDLIENRYENSKEMTRLIERQLDAAIKLSKSKPPQIFGVIGEQFLPVSGKMKTGEVIPGSPAARKQFDQEERKAASRGLEQEANAFKTLTKRTEEAERNAQKLQASYDRLDLTRALDEYLADISSVEQAADDLLKKLSSVPGTGQSVLSDFDKRLKSAIENRGAGRQQPLQLLQLEKLQKKLLEAEIDGVNVSENKARVENLIADLKSKQIPTSKESVSLVGKEIAAARLRLGISQSQAKIDGKIADALKRAVGGPSKKINDLAAQQKYAVQLNDTYQEMEQLLERIGKASITEAQKLKLSFSIDQAKNALYENKLEIAQGITEEVDRQLKLERSLQSVADRKKTIRSSWATAFAKAGEIRQEMGAENLQEQAAAGKAMQKQLDALLDIQNQYAIAEGKGIKFLQEKVALGRIINNLSSGEVGFAKANVSAIGENIKQFRAYIGYRRNQAILAGTYAPGGSANGGAEQLEARRQRLLELARGGLGQLINLEKQGVVVSDERLGLEEAINDIQNLRNKASKEELSLLAQKVVAARNFASGMAISLKAGNISGVGIQAVLESLRGARETGKEFLGSLSPAEGIDKIVREFNSGKLGSATKGSAGVADSITQSFTTGLQAGIPQAVSAAIAFSQAVIEGFRNKFQARSPAKAITKKVVIPIVEAFEGLRDFAGRGVASAKFFASSMLGSLESDASNFKNKTRQVAISGYQPQERSDLATRLTGFLARTSSNPGFYRKLAMLAGEDITSSSAITEAIYRKQYEKGNIIPSFLLPASKRREVRGTPGLPGFGLEEAIAKSAFAATQKTGSFISPLGGPLRLTTGVSSVLGPGLGVPSLPSGRPANIAAIFNAQTTNAQDAVGEIYSMVGKNTFREFSQRATQITAASRPGLINELKTNVSIASAEVIGKANAIAASGRASLSPVVSKGRSGVTAAVDFLDDIASLAKTAATATGLNTRVKQATQPLDNFLKDLSSLATRAGADTGQQSKAIFSRIKDKIDAASGFAEEVFAMSRNVGDVLGLVGGGPRPPSGGRRGGPYRDPGDMGDRAREAGRQGPEALLGLAALANPAKASTKELEILSSALKEFRSVLDPTTKNFNKLDSQFRETIGIIDGVLERRAPNADFLTRNFGARGGRAISEGLIGGAFPLLFGQGLGASVFGLAGGAAGGFAGGSLGFGLSLVGTAIGSIFDQLAQNAQDAGKALNYPIEGFEKLKEANLFASRSQEFYISKLIEFGQVGKATAEIQAEMIRKIGVSGVNDLMKLGDASSRLSKAWAEFTLQLQATLAGPMAGLLDWVTQIVESYNRASREEARSKEIRAGLPKKYQEQFDTLKRKTLVEEALGLDFRTSTAEINRKFEGKVDPSLLNKVMEDKSDQDMAARQKALQDQRQVADQIKSAYREGFQLQQRIIDLERKAIDIRKRIENEIFNKQQEILRQQIDNDRKRAQIAIEQVDLDYRKRIANERGRVAEALAAEAELMKTRAEGEATISAAKKMLELDIAKQQRETQNYVYNLAREADSIRRETLSLEMEVADYRLSIERKIEDQRLVTKAAEKARTGAKAAATAETRAEVETAVAKATKSSAVATKKEGGPRMSIVDVGRALQKAGFTVKEHPAFGGVTPGAHSPTGYHPIGQAIDVTDWRPGNWRGRTKKLKQVMQGAGFAEVFGPGDKGHDTHLHLAVGSGGVSRQAFEKALSAFTGGKLSTTDSITSQLKEAKSQASRRPAIKPIPVAGIAGTMQALDVRGNKIREESIGLEEKLLRLKEQGALQRLYEVARGSVELEQRQEAVDLARSELAAIGSVSQDREESLLFEIQALKTLEERRKTDTRLLKNIRKLRSDEYKELERQVAVGLVNTQKEIDLGREMLQITQERRFLEARSTLQRQLAVTGTAEKAGFFGASASAYTNELLRSGNAGRANELAQLTKAQETSQAVASIRNELNSLLDPTNQTITAANAIGGAFSESFSSVISGSTSAQEALTSFFKGVAGGFLDMASQIIQKWIVMTILNNTLRIFPSASAGGFSFGGQSGGFNLSGFEAPSYMQAGFDFGGQNSGFGLPGLKTPGYMQTENIFGYASGGILESPVEKFAMGGVFTNSILTSPTLFSFTDGGVPKAGLGGEAGDEAVMPLTRGRGGRLGVDASGVGGGDVNVTVHVDAKGTNVEGNQQQGEALGRVIAAAVQTEILKQKRPGGLLA